MKSLRQNQAGLIPILIAVLVVVVGVIFLVYLRVKNAQ